MKWILITIASAVLSGCAGGGGGNPGGNPPVGNDQPIPFGLGSNTVQKPEAAIWRTGVYLSSSQTGLEAGVTGLDFQFLQLKDLWIRIIVPGMSTGLLELTFINPKGEVYYEHSFMFSTDPNMKQMNMNDAPHPIDVATAKPVQGGYALDVAIPVSGSVMTRVPTVSEGDWILEAKVPGFGVLSQSFHVTFQQ